MKPTIKSSLLSAVVGTIVMFVIFVIFEYITSRHPNLDTQVIEHLERSGYIVDTVEVDALGESLYTFQVDDYKLFYDYDSSDPAYLCFFIEYSPQEYGDCRAELSLAVINVMKDGINCAVTTDLTITCPVVYIYSESFINPDEILDTRIIDRSIQTIIESYDYFLYEFNRIKNLERQNKMSITASSMMPTERE